jgi:hypothetical protein
MMLERQREGIAKAKAEGKYKGRKPTARAKADDAVKLFRGARPSPRSRQHWRLGEGRSTGPWRLRESGRRPAFEGRQAAIFFGAYVAAGLRGSSRRRLLGGGDLHKGQRRDECRPN